MVHKLAVTGAVILSLVVAREVSAVPISATNLDTWMASAGVLYAGPSVDVFDVASPPPANNGTIDSEVFFNSSTGLYTYTHTVTPTLENNSEFNTAFVIPGFGSQIAGWSFSEADAVNGAGTDADFVIEDFGGRLLWRPLFGGGTGWDGLESITFFFVSTKGPTMGEYNLFAAKPGTAQSFAPVPEPGSIALLGSGLVGLYAAVRRRRNLRA
jgi:PEP-CTERM motif